VTNISILNNIYYQHGITVVKQK